MKIKQHKNFTKHYQKRILSNVALHKKFQQRFKLFLESSVDPILKDHSLTGDMQGYRSFWVTGDVRVIYRIEKDAIILIDIGTHTQVYGM